jgi:hypothetical protein
MLKIAKKYKGAGAEALALMIEAAILIREGIELDKAESLLSQVDDNVLAVEALKIDSASLRQELLVARHKAAATAARKDALQTEIDIAQTLAGTWKSGSGRSQDPIRAVRQGYGKAFQCGGCFRCQSGRGDHSQS